ncbi:hypothetical protein JM81_0426 [Maribacter sp. MAR_2009_72]|nr:hypothetical protein JM81_0426 [Maribacter sp. MAR_2009_72]
MLTPPKQIIYPLIKAPEFNAEFLGWLTVVFLVLAVLYFLGTFLIRNKLGSQGALTKDKKMEFSPMISEFLFYEDSNTKEEKKTYLNLKVQIRESIKNNFDRNVLTEVLLDLRKDLSGQSQDVLMALYKDLGLHITAYDKLSSRRWQIISSGILELTAMEVHEGYTLIIKFINHRQSTIRKQAERAVVSLKEEGICYFLDNTKYRISEWQQLKLLDILRHKSDFVPPQFSLWLTSTNVDVVLFSLRLIKYFKQNNAEKSIITLLKHKKKVIQLEAIDCIKEFYFINAIPTLKLVYPKAGNDVKIAILDAIGEIGTKNELQFLQHWHSKERNFNIKSKVIGTINKIDPESILPTSNIKKTAFFTSDIEEDIEPTIIVQQEEEIEQLATQLDETEQVNKPVELISEKKETSEYEELTIPEIKDVQEITPETHDMDEEILVLDDLMPMETMGNELTEMENQLIDLPQENTEEPIEDLEENIETELVLDFLPLVIDEPQEEPVLLNEGIDEPDFDFALEDSPLQEEELTVQQVLNKSLLDFKEIDWVALTEDVSELPMQETTDAIVFNNTSRTNVLSLSADFLDDEELETMVLLENIADMGDNRELPVLQNILDNSISTIIADRANELIQKFSYEMPRPAELFAPDNALSESVFAEIFHLSDIETQFILLDEIKKIGDEKEMALLQSLINGNNEALAKKAEEVLQVVTDNLAKTEKRGDDEMENNLFQLDFELELESATKSNSANSLKEGGSTLFDHLCAMSSSFYTKKNG